MVEPTRLDDGDWEALLKSAVFKLGRRDLHIRPLGLEDLGDITKSIQRIAGEFKEREITLENFRSDKLGELITLLVQNAPDIMEKLTGLHREDVGKLPLETLTGLFNLALDVNLESQEELAKNLTALAEKMGSLAAGVQQSMGSSPLFARGTVGETSESTAQDN